MAQGAEDILLSVENVRYRNSDGVLYLMATRIGWSNQRSDHLKLTVAYQDIKAQLISPPKKERVQLQLELHSGAKETFLFNNPANRDKQLKDRDAVKDLLVQLLPKFRQRLSAEFEGKTSLLERSPELLQLYKDLVPSGIVTAEEFWATYQQLADPKLPAQTQSQSQQSQQAGVSADFLSEIKPVSQGGGFKYSLTEDIIKAIFATYPAVKRKHAQLVPQALSEQEFWLRFFQSHYFHRDRLHVGRDEVFADCAADDEARFRRVMEQVTPDVFLDLTRLADADNYRDDAVVGGVPGIGGGAAGTSAGAGAGGLATPLVAGQQLIRRCNQHSLMVLQAETTVTAAASTATAAAASSAVSNGNANAAAEESAAAGTEAKRRRLRELTRFEDLGGGSSGAKNDNDPGEEEDLEGGLLALETIERYLFGPAAEGAGGSSVDGGRRVAVGTPDVLPEAKVIRACEVSLHHLDKWPDLQLAGACSQEEAVEALKDLSAGGQLFDGKAARTKLQGYRRHQALPSVEAETELRCLSRTQAELLRHFWACFPVTSQQLEDKLDRIRQALDKFDSEKVAPVAARWPDSCGHLASLLETARAKHDQYLSKKPRR